MIAHSLLGVDIIVVPDDDERMDGVPQGHACLQGPRMFVRESQWPAVREELRSRTTNGTPGA